MTWEVVTGQDARNMPVQHFLMVRSFVNVSPGAYQFIVYFRTSSTISLAQKSRLQHCHCKHREQTSLSKFWERILFFQPATSWTNRWWPRFNKEGVDTMLSSQDSRDTAYCKRLHNTIALGDDNKSCLHHSTGETKTWFIPNPQLDIHWRFRTEISFRLATSRMEQTTSVLSVLSDMCKARNKFDNQS
jgi:hypothetical protein